MRYWVWILLLSLVIFRFLTTQKTYSNGTKLRISGQITQEPTVFSNSQRIFLSGLKIYIERFPEVRYGDRVVVEGVVEDGELKNPKLLSHSDTNNILIKFKRSLVSFWQNTLPEPHSALVAGITLGYKANLPQSFSDELRSTGTSHVVVASGMNVTFVAGFLLSLLILIMPRPKALLFSALGIISYCIITGLEAPIVRAAIMAGFIFMAQISGRVSQTVRVLFLTVFLMLLIKPAWITDIGFILSFAATLSLVLFESKVNSKLSFVPEVFRESLSTSITAQIGVAPIIFLTFGQFNLLSPLINALVLWTVPLIMIIGGVGGIVGLILPELGKIILYLCYPLTSWFIWIIHLFGNI